MSVCITDPSESRTAVFVTTQELASLGVRGRGEWFELKDYKDHDMFMRAVTDFAKNTLKSDAPLHFSIRNAAFNLGELFSSNRLMPQIWHMIKLDDYDMNVLHAYVSRFGMIEAVDVRHTLQLMTDNFKGLFRTQRDYLDSDRNATMDGIVNVNGYYFTDH